MFLYELYNSDFNLFVRRLGRTQEHLWMALGWRGHVCGAREFYFLRDSAQTILQIFPAPFCTKKPALSFISPVFPNLQILFHLKQQLHVVIYYTNS
jgi:hypothetical protein